MIASHYASDFNAEVKKLSFIGFLAPIGGADATGGSSIDPIRAFKLKSTIPVKMILTREGVPITTGVHTLQLSKVNNSTTLDTAIDATPTDVATTGNAFKLADATTGEWHFNLSTNTLSKGIWQIKVTLSDLKIHKAFIDSKRDSSVKNLLFVHPFSDCAFVDAQGFADFFI